MLCKNQKTLCKNQDTLPSLFKPPSPNFPISQAPLLRIPYFPLPPYDLISSQCQRVALRAPFKHRPKAHLLFLTWHGPEEPFLPFHRIALRGNEPPLLGCLMILHFRPRRPRRFHLLRVVRPLVLPLLLLGVDMRRGDHLLH